MSSKFTGPSDADRANAWSVRDRRIVVTGGTGGLGRAICLELAREGADVIASYAHREEPASALISAAAAEQLSVRLVRGDLTSAEGRQRVMTEVGETSLDGLVHCAATGVHRRVEELTTRQWDFTFALNVSAFLLLVQQLLPKFAAGASLVALSSEGAVRVVPAYAAIGASKGALESLCRYLAVELASRQIRVNVLAPGHVITPAWEAFPDAEARLDEARRHTPRGQLVTAEEVAQVARFLCSPASTGINGQKLVVDGGRSIVGQL